MTVSGNFDWTLTRNQIIESALRNVGALAQAQNASAQQISDGTLMLNAVLKNMRAKEEWIWYLDYITIPMVASSVVLGTDGFDYECIRGHVAAADNRPITGGDYPTFWKRLDTSVGPAWVTGTSYHSICEYTLDSNVIGVTDIVVQNTNNTDFYQRLLTPMSREDYAGLSNPILTGRPTQYYFFRQDSPDIFLYPYPDSLSYVIQMYVYRYPDDMTNGTNTTNLLSEWMLPLIFALSLYMAPSQGISDQRFDRLQALYKESLANARSADHEMGDTLISPRTEW